MCGAACRLCGDSCRESSLASIQVPLPCAHALRERGDVRPEFGARTTRVHRIEVVWTTLSGPNPTSRRPGMAVGTTANIFGLAAGHVMARGATARQCLQLDFGCQNHDAVRRHVEKFGRLRAASLHKRERARLKPGKPRPGSRTYQVPAQEERGILGENLQSLATRVAYGFTDIRCLHEAKSCAHVVHIRQQLFDDDAAQRVAARHTLDLHVQDHDLRVVNLVVFEIAQ